MELLAKLGINWQLLIAQVVNFMIVLGVLSYLVYKPLLDLLDKRTERVRKAMEEAKRLEEEAESLSRQRIERLKKIDEEAGILLAQARVTAEAMHSDMLDKAHKDSQKLLEKGRQDIAAERAAALRDMQDTLAKVITQLTEKLLERTFTPEDQKKALEEVTRSIPTLLR